MGIKLMGPARREGQPLPDWLKETRVDEENAVKLCGLLLAGALLTMAVSKLLMAGAAALVAAVCS